jgi:hypothetical protein
MPTQAATSVPAPAPAATLAAPSSQRTIWLLAALVALVVLLLSIRVMMHRIGAFHENNPRQIFAFREVITDSFSYAGRDVSIQREQPATDQAQQAAASGVQFLVLAYGDAQERIKVEIPNTTTPGRDLLPGLKPYEDWLKVFRMANTNGQSPQTFLEGLDAGTIPDRLVIVTRIPFPGSDPATWGSVWKKDWQFDFRELTRDGRIERYERLNYPTARGIRKPKPGELHENTWQFQAALQMMPQAGQIGPTHNFFNNGIAAAGWTIPAAAFSGLLLCISIAFAFAPQRRIA